MYENHYDIERGFLGVGGNQNTATLYLKTIKVWGHTLLGSLEGALPAATITVGFFCAIVAALYHDSCTLEESSCHNSLEDALIWTAGISGGIAGGIGGFMGGIFAHRQSNKEEGMSCANHASILYHSAAWPLAVLSEYNPAP